MTERGGGGERGRVRERDSDIERQCGEGGRESIGGSGQSRVKKVK